MFKTYEVFSYNVYVNFKMFFYYYKKISFYLGLDIYSLPSYHILCIHIQLIYNRTIRVQFIDLNANSAAQLHFQDQIAKDRRKAKSEWNRVNSSLYQLLYRRTSALADHVSCHAMEMTQVVVLQQNIQRKKMIGRIKVGVV